MEGREKGDRMRKGMIIVVVMVMIDKVVRCCSHKPGLLIFP